LSPPALPADPASIVEEVLRWAVAQGATDIHFSPRPGDGVVRARIDGLLRDAFSLPAALFTKVASRIKILAELDISEKRRPQDGRISWSMDGRRLDFRVSSLPALHGESVVLRVLGRFGGPITIDELGLNQRERREVRSLISNPSGLVLVTGPTGAGKTTTLYAALLELATPERNVLSLEDPIEYEVPWAVQTAVQSRLDLSFAGLLRSVLRHDPDVIMVGEVRDPETAQIAVRAALTGHLVLTSLHTQRAADAVSALLQFGVPPYALAPALRGVINQQLVRSICSQCRTAFEYGEGLLEDPDLKRVLAPGTLPSFSIGQGCEECFQSGYRGRQAIFEILEVDAAIRELIFRSGSAAEIETAAVESGMLTLRQKGFRAVLEGITTAEEVVQAITLD
jgi:type II secretory ATPase GspE/PulE/Tfp pilus assembly ATPase PilB-like protein